jgi:hypothetical protein
LSIAACRSGSTTSLKTTGEFTARAWPEADQLFHREPRWLGADAAFSVPLGGERVLWLFGDTFIATSNALERRASRMVRNTIAVQRGLDPSTADIEFQWGSGPSSWIADEPQRWFWPQHGVRLPAGPLVLFFSSVRSTPDEGFGFEADGWIAVAVDNPDEPCERWSPRRLQSADLPPGILPAQGLFLDGEFIYGLAIREPGDHAGYALRISAAALARGELSELELWDGQWSRTRVDLRPTPVLKDAAPELSLHFDARLQRFVHVRTLGFGDTELSLATARQLTGPWSQPLVVYRPPESDREGALVYAAKAHPELLGADLVATYASNSFDFDTLVRDSTLYYPRFVRISYPRAVESTARGEPGGR